METLARIFASLAIAVLLIYGSEVTGIFKFQSFTSAMIAAASGVAFAEIIRFVAETWWRT